MKLTKTALFSFLAVLVVGAVFSTSMVSAYRGDYSVEGPNYNDERHIAMETAMDTNNLDYDAWYTLMTQDGRHPRVVDVVTETNFETFVQAHQAAQDGELETAAELRAELGLHNGKGPRDGAGYGKSQGNGQGMKQGMMQHRMQN